jgi:hypothetical protein
MKVYHIFFFLLQLVILCAIALIYIKQFSTKNNVYIIIDSLFKFSLGLFIVTYFLTNKEHKIQIYDRILIILFGLTLLALIDYIALMNIVFQINLSDPYSIQQKNK